MDILTPRRILCPVMLGWPRVGWWYDWSRGFTVNGEPVYLAALHPKCGAVGPCPGSCLAWDY